MSAATGIFPVYLRIEKEPRERLEVHEDHIAFGVVQNVSVLQIVMSKHHFELLLLRQSEHTVDLLRNQVESNVFEAIAGACE